MHPSFSLSFLLFLLYLLPLVSTEIPTTFSAIDARNVNCRREFACGKIASIKYPFWGVNRSDFCGQPGFQLDCRHNNIPLLSPSSTSQKYRVLEINSQTNTLMVARDDFYGNLCPAILVNTTLNSAVFSHTAELRELALFYGCSFSEVPSGLSVEVNLNCTINNPSTNLFYATRNLTVDSRSGSCSRVVVVPVLERNAVALEANAMSLGAAIDGGFELKWSADDDQCNECGYNQTESQFTCFCPDHQQQQPDRNVCLGRPGSYAMHNFVRI